MASSLKIILIFTLSTTGIYSLQCPTITGDHNERHGHWETDKMRDRCILKCLEGYEPSSCHVLRKTDKNEWTYTIPNCILVKASYLPGCTATMIGAAVVVGVGAVVGAPFALAAAGFGSAGVVAGSLAAGIQTPFTAAGSWFAGLQSAGVVGMAAGTLFTIGTVTAGVTYAFMSPQCEVE